MRRKQMLIGAGSALGMLVLILDGKTALEGAKDGIFLCLSTVIPSLFPFFVLTILLTGTLLGSSTGILRPLGRLWGLGHGAQALLIPALLGGYPAGAQAVALAWESGQLCKEDAQRLLPLCNQPGPAFLFGMVSLFFPQRRMIWALWAVVILSALLTAQLFSCNKVSAQLISIPADKSVSGVLRSAMGTMASVCGWVVLFRVILAFFGRWFLWLLPVNGQVIVTGMLELSNGCILLEKITSPSLRFCVAAGMLSFGGICVGMQTASVAKALSLKPYWLAKTVQTVWALVLASAIAYGAWLPLGAAILFLAIVRQKKGSFPATAGV